MCKASEICEYPTYWMDCDVRHTLIKRVHKFTEDGCDEWMSFISKFNIDSTLNHKVIIAFSGKLACLNVVTPLTTLSVSPTLTIVTQLTGL